MEIQIKTKPAFSVLGIEGRGDADRGPEWIQPLWNKAFNRFDEIKDLVKSDQSGPQREAWGLMSATDEYLAPWKNEGKYLVGWEVNPGTKPPKGWTVWDVPEQTYAVIGCTMATYGEAYKFVIQQFLPARALCMSSIPENSETSKKTHCTCTSLSRRNRTRALFPLCTRTSISRRLLLL